MNPSGLLLLPPGVMFGFVLLLWPALWAGALIIMSIAADLLRQSTGHPTGAWPKIA